MVVLTCGSPRPAICHSPLRQVLCGAAWMPQQRVPTNFDPSTKGRGLRARVVPFSKCSWQAGRTHTSWPPGLYFFLPRFRGADLDATPPDSNFLYSCLGIAGGSLFVQCTRLFA